VNPIQPFQPTLPQVAARRKSEPQAEAPVETSANRIRELEAELQQCYGTYMYCEAADFQSAEERATSRRMSERMGQISTELAQLRGAGALNRENVKAQVEVMLERQPLARLGSRAFKAVYPACRHTGYGVDDPAGRLHSAVRHGFLTQEQVDEKVIRSASRRKPTASGSDDEVRQAAAEALTRALPRELEGLFPDLKAFLEFQSQTPSPLAEAVKGLIAEGLVELRLEDVNRARRVIYAPGELGQAVERYRKTPQDSLLGSIGRLLDQKLPYTEEEREQALTCAATSLVKKEQDAKDDWSRRRFEEDKQRWLQRGLTEEHLKAALLGGRAPTVGGSVVETPDWIVFGSSRVARKSP
jgi:hypothetical protein